MSTQIQNGKNYVIKGELLNEIGHAFSIDNTYEETLYINNIPNAIKDLQQQKADAVTEKNQALQDKTKAENEKNQALEEKIEAVNARDQALEAKADAENERDQALEDKEIAESVFYATLVCETEIPSSEAQEIGVETIAPIEGENYTYVLKSSSPVTELNISGKQVKALNIVKADDLNKLICYDNQLTALDLKNCSNLQFLHMHDNPICDNNDYLDNLVECINSLPNRRNKACGSIVYSPWFDLPVLCYVYATETSIRLWKYPNVEDKHIIHATKEIKPFYKQYIGLVPTDKKLSYISDGKTTKVASSYTSGSIRYYYVQENGKVQKDEKSIKIERWQNLRQLLEQTRTTETSLIYETAPLTNIAQPPQVNAGLGTLSKNWLFGSAIQYSNEWNTSCPRYFRDLHVADFWETAEYGFGAKVAHFDEFHKGSDTAPQPYYWDQWNVLLEDQDFKLSQSGFTSEKQDLFEHGTGIGLLIAGRGQAQGATLGLIPQCIYMPRFGASMLPDSFINNHLNFFKDKANCWTCSYDGIKENTSNGSKVANNQDFIDFKKKFFCCNCAGNRGVNGQWTAIPPSHLNQYGENIYWVTSLDSDKTWSAYSNPNSLFTQQTTIPMYGTTYAKYTDNNETPHAHKFLGTSMAAPLATSYLCLLRNVYDKMYPLMPGEERSYGYGSDFMDYVFQHWTEELPNSMLTTSSTGLLNIFGNQKSNNNNGEWYDFNYDYFTLNEHNKILPIRANLSNEKIKKYNNEAAAVIESTITLLKIDMPTNTLTTVETIPSNSQEWTQSFYVDPKNLQLVADWYTKTTNVGVRLMPITGKQAYTGYGTIAGTSSKETKTVYEIMLARQDSNKDAVGFYLSNFAATVSGNDKILSNPIIYPRSSEGHPALEDGTLIAENFVRVLWKSDGQSARHTYSWLNFGNMQNLGRSSLEASECIIQLNTLKFDFNLPFVLTITCDNSNHLTIYWNGTKIKEWYTDFNWTIEPFETPKYVKTYNFNKKLSHQEVIDYTIHLLNQ